MVRRLVEQQDVRLLQQQTAQRDAAFFTAGENLTRRFRPADSAARPSPFRAATSRSHASAASSFSCTSPWRSSSFVISSSSIGSANFALISSNSFSRSTIGLHALLDDLADGLRRIELRFLLEKTDRVARRNGVLPLNSLSTPARYAQQRALAGAIQAEDADLRAVEIRKIDVFEDGFLVVKLADSDHGVDDFVRNSAQISTSSSMSAPSNEGVNNVYKFTLANAAVIESEIPGCLDFMPSRNSRISRRTLSFSPQTQAMGRNP